MRPRPRRVLIIHNMETARAAAQIANDNFEAGKMAQVNLKQLRDSAADALRLEVTAVATGCEMKAKGDAVSFDGDGL